MGYGWEDMREDEEIEYAYAEEREREDEEKYEAEQQRKRDEFDLGFAEYENTLRVDKEGEDA